MDLYCFKVDGLKPGECLGVLDSYTSLNFTKSFQECGSFTIKGNFTKGAAPLLQVGNLVYINRRMSGIIHSIDYNTGEDGITSYTVYGMELKGILGYRIVWDTYNHNLPANKWIEGLVQANTKGNRALFSSIQEPQIACPNLDRQTSYTKLSTAVTDACSAQLTSNGMLLGWDVLCDIDNGFTFTLVEGADRSYESAEPLLVSRDMDNISTLQLAISDKSTANVVKCGGEGDGSARKFVTAGDFSKTGLARREYFADKREVQSTYVDSSDNTQHMTDEEYTSLLQHEADACLEGSTISMDAETTAVRIDAVPLLGAKVTLMDRQFGVHADDYVTEINIIDESQGEYTTLTVGKELTAKALVLP